MASSASDGSPCQSARAAHVPASRRDLGQAELVEDTEHPVLRPIVKVALDRVPRRIAGLDNPPPRA